MCAGGVCAGHVCVMYVRVYMCAGRVCVHGMYVFMFVQDVSVCVGHTSCTHIHTDQGCLCWGAHVNVPYKTSCVCWRGVGCRTIYISLSLHTWTNTTTLMKQEVLCKVYLQESQYLSLYPNHPIPLSLSILTLISPSSLSLFLPGRRMKKSTQRSAGSSSSCSAVWRCT